MSEMSTDEKLAARLFGCDDWSEFEYEICRVINRHSVDAECNTPDFILAGFVVNSIMAYRSATRSTGNWRGLD